MSEIDRLAREKFARQQRQGAVDAATAIREQRTTEQSVRSRLTSAIARALEEFPVTRVDQMVPYPVRTKSALFPKKTVLASWEVAQVFRPETSRRDAGNQPIYLLSNGFLIGAPPPPRGEHQLASSGLEGSEFTLQDELVSICNQIERLLR